MTRFDSDSIGKEEKVNFVDILNLNIFLPYLQSQMGYITKAKADMLSFSTIVPYFPQFTYQLFYGSTLYGRHCTK